ncbi:MAG: hypothetical protein COA97_11575 [Flavobacteriales bacterium]|nr:MAG: hypothetical protein COA97_11575 [Flavobacteriales bacterium]
MNIFKLNIKLVLTLISILFFTEIGKSAVYSTDYESASKGSYACGAVTLNGISWNFCDALIGSLANDRKNGAQSARVRNTGTMTMLADKTSGAGTIGVYHAKYGSDGNSTWRLEVSNDGGATWTAYVSPTITTSSTTLSLASFSANVSGNIRVRILKLTGGGNRINFDDFSITDDVACTPVSEPLVNASAYTFTNIGCNGIQISWTSPIANDSSLVVMKAGSNVTTDPIDGTVYSANSTFGSGSDIGTSEFVVYNGSGTSLIVSGLAASTTYFIKIFEYNGESTCVDYRTSDEISSSESTVACDTCAYMTAALINSCDNLPCTEGDNEMLFFNSGNYYVSTADADITINYGSTSPASNTYGDSFTANPTAITSMNADPGCSGIYIDATTVEFIPPNTSFLILNETVCADAFDWSSLCAGGGNIYVLFSSDATWTSSGQFSNSPPLSGRFFRTIFGGCTLDYSYDNTLPAGDGAIVFWDETAGTPVSYDTDGCSLPASVLPVTLLYFDGNAIKNSSNLLEWSTSSEINNDYFTLEHSANATDFNPIGIVYGAGNSSSQLFYQLIDDNPIAGINYYRLKQTDLDGEYAYSSIIVINNQFSGIKIYASNNSLFIESNNSNISGSLQIFDLTGRIVVDSKINSNSRIGLSVLNSGTYIYQFISENNIISDKFIVQ